MLDIYDCKMEMLCIGPFHYEPLGSVSLWLNMPDDVILKHLSTSPEVEPAHFVAQTRSALKHIEQHPFPAVTIFPENRPHYYRMNDGMWIQVRY